MPSSSAHTTVRNIAHIIADAVPIHLLISRSILPSLVNKPPRYFNSFTWGSNSSHPIPNPEGARRHFPAESRGIRLGGADSHPDRSIFDCKPPQADQCDTPIIGEHPPVCHFLKKGTTTPVYHSECTVPDVQATLKRCVSQDSPTMSRVFSISERISSVPGILPLRSFVTTLRPLPRIWVRLPLSLQVLPLPQKMRSGVPQSALSTAPQYPQSGLAVLLPC